MRAEIPERRSTVVASLGNAVSRALRNAAVFSVAMALSSSLVAQQPTPVSSFLRVYLENEAGTPVKGAEVTVKAGRNERVMRADSTGLARFDSVRTGDIEIFVRRLGMKAVTLQTKVQQGDNSVTVFVDETPTLLEERRVTDTRPVVGRHQELEMRLKRQEASSVVLAAEIEKRNPVKLSSMLRRLPGLTIADSLGQTVAISSRGMKPSLMSKVNCIMRVMIDGILMAPQTSLDAIVPTEVYAVEVFNGPARIPPTLSASRTDSWCGLIAIWTK